MTMPTSSSQDQRSGAGDKRASEVTVGRCNELIIEPTGAPRRARRHATARRFAQGFTLIELMLVVAVAGVLSGVAYPSFMGQLQKIRRADAMVAVLQVQAAQERWRANNLAYGALAEIGVAPTSAAGHYTLQINAPSATGYEIIAAATGSQAHDTPCRTLRLRIDGGNLVQTSGADAATANAPQQNRQCWMV
ncbi:MAG: type IV pilin protein [Burkholderiaceae bacterium]